ncbi:flavin reductase [Caballeronia sp. LP003]|uniref:flavin reductase n=1 Tax=Caballeronia sp. LP003 TaxID=3038551 RepID=UPI002866F825|nr:flavin reductase [Caballeronia sp. LP003]MDR5785504.1 flavin reductase [Caballeronia sp. LP003]
MDNIHSQTFDKRALRDTLGAFTTGVTIITTCDKQGVPHGLTANSFSSVSLDPPLVLWSQSLASASYAAFHQSEHFAVNILADDQVSVSNAFAKSGGDKFRDVDFLTGIEGIPLLRDTAAHLQCKKIAEYPGGDHVVYLGHVERFGMTGRRPLAFSNGRYMVPYAHELGPMSLLISGAKPAPVSAFNKVRNELPRIAHDLGGHTIALGVWGNHGPTIIHWEPSVQPVSDYLPLGLVVSCTRTATGLCFSAFTPRATTQSFIAEDLRQWRDPNEDTGVQRTKFDERIDQIRQDGYVQVIDNEPSILHKTKTIAISVPLFGPGSEMVFSLSLVAKTSCMAERVARDVSDDLVRTAAELSACLIDGA